MPRIRRGATGSAIVHVLNRGNNRATIFANSGEYQEFVQLLAKTRKRFGLRIYAFALMPNHFHMVVQPDDVAQLSRFMQCWQTAHARRFHKRNGTSGHVWQGRFKSFPIQDGEHLLTVLRYVLLNPVRAGLVADAWSWPWTSLNHGQLISEWPVRPPHELQSWLAEGLSETAVDQVRESVARRTPFGDEAWRREIAEEAGLDATLRSRGRPPADRDDPYRFCA